MTRLEAIKDALENLSDDEIVSVHNEYCYNCNNLDDHIYTMDEFDEICDGMTPWEVARGCFYGTFCPANKYFWFNGYGNFDSQDYVGGEIDMNGIAEYIDENDDALYCGEIQDVLDSFEDEDEDEDEDEEDDVVCE